MDNIQNINNILNSFKISAVCKNYLDCSNACFYDLELKPGTRINQLKKYGLEIALALKSFGRPRFEVLAEQGIVRCEIIKKRNEGVSLFSLGNKVLRPLGELTCLLGETLLGEPLWLDLTKQPHMLIAGCTGSGKSTILHLIIANMLLYQNVNLFLIDPKGIEFNKYQNIKNITLAYDYNNSINMLKFLCQEMENRFSLIRENKINVSDLPYLVLIIDEFADIRLQDTGNLFYNLMCKLAQKSRAAGIHIICSTQRPSANIINGAIKANFPSRISCKVASGVDSRVILDSTGAEDLLGLGDAILHSSQHNMLRFQAAFTSADLNCKYLNYESRTSP